MDLIEIGKRLNEIEKLLRKVQREIKKENKNYEYVSNLTHRLKGDKKVDNT